MKGLFWGLLSIWQQFGGIVYFGPSVWSMIDDRGENHEPLALTQTCKLLSADCCILCDIYQVDYSMPAYLQPGSSWSIPPKDRGKKDDVFAGSTLLHESWDPWSGQWGPWNSAQVHRVLPHQSSHQGETQTPQNLHPKLRLIWDEIWFEIEFEWQVEDILMIIVNLGSHITNLTAVLRKAIASSFAWYE